MSLTLREILELTSGKWVNSQELGRSADSIGVRRLADLARSQEGDLAFFFSRDYEHLVGSALPSVLITAEPFVAPMRSAQLPLVNQSAVVVCQDPYSAMATLTKRVASELSSVAHVPTSGRAEPPGLDSGAASVHPSAVVAPSAKLGRGVKVHAFAVIEADVELGDDTVVYPHCFLGRGVRVGKQSVLFPRVTLYEAVSIGDRVRIHAGTVIGADGFGYAPVLAPAPSGGGREVIDHAKIYHLGRVVVGDDVEIGANCTVDRATLGETRIEQRAKLDNLVHLGHNSRVEIGALICGGTCLAGGAEVGAFAVVGGLSGIANRIRVGDRAQVGALTLVTKDVAPGGTAVGNPQREYRAHFKAHAFLNRMVESGKRDSQSSPESGKSHRPKPG